MEANLAFSSSFNHNELIKITFVLKVEYIP
jgi:hypothetical protein